jgi:hypothetical protein
MSQSNVDSMLAQFGYDIESINDITEHAEYDNLSQEERLAFSKLNIEQAREFLSTTSARRENSAFALQLP